MPKLVTYVANYPWSPATNRPYAEVKITGPSGSRKVWCLVDSGADKLLLDLVFASHCGLSMASARLVSMRTASGVVVTAHEVPGVSLEIEGTPVTQDVRFLAGALPLLGRVTFLNTFSDVGFDVSGWMSA